MGKEMEMSCINLGAATTAPITCQSAFPGLRNDLAVGRIVKRESANYSKDVLGVGQKTMLFAAI
jgi:hypothetical protein